MKLLAVIALTEGGKKIAERIYHLARKKPDLYVIPRLKHNNDFFKPLDEHKKFAESITSLWTQYDGLIFIMSTGIVVRNISKLLDNKAKDPAVVVVDELGKHAISLLSGHIGGANKLAQELGVLLDCQPVITTATDINHITGIDSLARDLNIGLEPLISIKKFNVHLLKGGKLNFWLDDYIIDKFSIFFPDCNVSKLSDFQNKNNDLEWHVFVTNKQLSSLPINYIYWRPKNLHVGIGCRKNISFENILENLTSVFKKGRLSLQSIKSISSIEIKADEPAILIMQHHLKVPFIVFSKEEIKHQLEIDELSTSNFVKERIGVEGVCEPAALLASRGQLLIKKQCLKGTTIAVAQEKSILLERGQENWLN